MIAAWIAAVALAAAGEDGRQPPGAYPSCDLAAQHRLPAETGGAITDPRQARIAMRASILQADLASARVARRLTDRQASRLWGQVDAIRTEADRYTREQGFLSAGETASYDRMLDGIARSLCRRR